MTARTLRPRGGFSLVEMMVATTVVLLTVGVAMMGFLSQTRSLQSLDLTRESNAQIRDATLQLESSLRSAGWGIDPSYAIDLSYRCPALGTCRDRTDGPDELTFVSRNPRYRWRAAGEDGCPTGTAGGCFDGNARPVVSVDIASNPRKLTVDLPANMYLERGRVLLATCQGGQDPVMLTLSQRYGSTSGGLAILDLPAGVASPYNDPASLKACHGQVGAGLFLVDRFHYFVTTYGGTPWLMLDTGIDLDNDGTLPAADPDDLTPVARDVEDLQVAYFLQPSTLYAAPDSGADWIVGNGAGAESVLDPAATAPTYATPPNDPSRFKRHPANVRGVRVSLTLRSARRDPAQDVTWAGETVAGTENRTGTLSGGGFRRVVARTEVTLRNMDSRSPFTF